MTLDDFITQLQELGVSPKDEIQIAYQSDEIEHVIAISDVQKFTDGSIWINMQKE